ncbi:MAG: hypothetical protein E6I30_11835 [Chloroflexi bacterium]|nr:MAG: hypothetical protein E6I30_11835 [Chloroflexota bacterium]
MRAFRKRRIAYALVGLVVLWALGLYVVPILPFVPRSVADLKFSVIDNVGEPLVCTGWGMPNPRSNPYGEYPHIVSDLPTYSAIIRREHLPPTPLTDDQVVADEVVGEVDLLGHVYEVHQGPGLGGCPICLAADSVISTPTGPVFASKIAIGMQVWSASPDGRPTVAVVLKMTSRLDAPGSEMIHIVLADGRQLTASAPHEIADGRSLGSLTVGDQIDGVTITALEVVGDSSGHTYDLLPSGETGEYWANGILMRSTLKPD